MSFNPLQEILPLQQTGSVLELGLKNCERPKFNRSGTLLAAFNRGYLTVWRVETNRLVPIWSWNSIFPKSVCTDFAWTSKGLAFGKVDFGANVKGISDAEYFDFDQHKGETFLLKIDNRKIFPLLPNAYLQYETDESQINLCCGSPTGFSTKDLILEFYELRLEGGAKKLSRFTRKGAGTLKIDKQFISIWKSNEGVLLCLGSNSKQLVQYTFISKAGSEIQFLPPNAGAFPFFKLGDPLPMFDYRGQLRILLSYFGETPVISVFKNWKLAESRLEVELKSHFPEMTPSPSLFSFSPNGKFFLVWNVSSSSNVTDLWAIDVNFKKRKFLCRISLASPMAWACNGLLTQGFDISNESTQYNLVAFPEGYVHNTSDLERALEGPSWEDAPPLLVHHEAIGPYYPMNSNDISTI